MRFLSRRRSGSAGVVRAARERAVPSLWRATQLETLEDRRLLAANLVVSLAAAPQPTVNAGADITYSLAVRNIGTDPANNVVVTFDPDDADVPPNERSVFRSANQLSGPGFTVVNPGLNNQGNVTLNLGTLNAGLAGTFTIVYRVNPTAPENGVINAVVTADSDETTVVTEDDSVVVSTRADVAVTKTQISPVGNATAGLDVTYEIVVVNNGPSTANNVSVVDIVPANTTFVSVSQTAGPNFTVNSTPTVGSAGTFQASILALGSGQSATFQITLHIASDVTGTVFNTATVQTTTFDPAQGNNLATVGGTVAVVTDLVITSVTNKATPIYEGSFFTYTVTIQNRGPSDATGVSFSWQMPNTGKTANREMVYYGPTPVTYVSGPTFNIGIPPDPPRRGTFTGVPTAANQRLQAGVGSTYTFQMGTSEDNDLVQVTTVTSASPDSNPANNSYTDEVHIFDAPLELVESPAIQGNDNQPLDATVMIFRDTNAWPGNSQVPAYTTPQGRLTEMLQPDFVATIDWGDGSAPSAGVITLSSAGEYHVAGRHTYSTAGNFPVKVTVTSDGESIVIGNSVATVGVPPRGGAAVAGLKFTENVTETKKIASFFRGSAPGSVTFSGTINWGDGSSSAATFQSTGTGLDIIGTHNFVDEGVYNATVTVNGSDGITNVIPVTITVDDRAVVGTAVTVNAQTGIQASNVPVATFTDPGGAKSPGSYNAIINWGDGTAPSAGIITFSSGTFTVSGTHTYLTAGTYNTTITVSHGTAPDTVINGTAIVSDGPINPAVNASPVNVTASANVAFTGPVATFTDPLGGPDVPANYVAIINWGDGTPTSNGVITFNAGTGTFTVTGTHTWATAGTYNMTVTIRHGNSPDAVVNPVATVTTASLISGTTAVSFNGVEGQTLASVIVGRFTSSNPAAVPADFAATINWGDGTASTSGTIVQTGPGAFNILGTHQYQDDGTFPVTVSVGPAGGGTPSVINSTAVIRDASLRGISRLFTATRNAPFNGVIGGFVDNNPFDISPNDYLVTVDWGDGTATTGAAITYNATLKQFNISGTHTYTSPSPLGGYKLTITVRDGLSQVTITSTATVA